MYLNTFLIHIARLKSYYQLQKTTAFCKSASLILSDAMQQMTGDMQRKKIMVTTASLAVIFLTYSVQHFPTTIS